MPGCAAIVLLLVGSVLPASEPASELKKHADAAQGGERAKLCMEYAHQELEAADVLFTQGEVEKAQATVRESVAYAHKAADAAVSSGKHLKQTEIDLRKLAKRMHDIGETLNFEDRGPVRQAVDEIEQVRTDLLNRMFGLKPDGKS